MSTRGSSTSTVLIIIVLIFTFPFWLALGGVLLGVVAGIFGAMVGVLGAIFGLLVAAIALPFKLLFGWGGCSFGFDWSPGIWLLLLIIAAVILRGRR